MEIIGGRMDEVFVTGSAFNPPILELVERVFDAFVLWTSAESTLKMDTVDRWICPLKQYRIGRSRPNNEALLDAYNAGRQEAGTQVSPFVSGVVSPRALKGETMKLLDFLNDKVVMFAALLVSLGTVTLMFISITPDFLFGIPKLVMGTMGAVLVLFSPRALIKRKFGLWRWIAALIIFSEVSTVLTMTDVQSQSATETVKVDPVLEHLQKATNSAQENLTKLIDQQAAANSRATLDALAEQIRTTTAVYQSASEAEKEATKTGALKSAGIDANKLFMAIPSAVMAGQFSRWMTLVFSLSVAVIFQLVVVATVSATVKQVKRTDAAAKSKTRHRRRAPKPMALLETGSIPMNESDPEKASFE